jgi:protein-disulfide isomerase
VASRAEKRRERRKDIRNEGSSSRLAWILGGVAVLALLIVGFQLVFSAFDSTVRSSVEVQYDSPEELIQIAQGVSTGNPDAPVTIIEFGDYQCPACQNFFRQAKPILDVSYIQPGRVEFVFYDFPLEGAHPNAFLAARAARCAGDQDAYWEYHDVLFQNQINWSLQADPVGDLVGYAEDLGLDRNTFRSCVRSDRHADVVSANQLLGLQLGAQSTPTVLLDTGDGRATWVNDWTTNLRPIIEEALAAAESEAMEESEGAGE